jgi:hypothetical protein
VTPRSQAGAPRGGASAGRGPPRSRLRSRRRDQDGASSIEPALVAAVAGAKLPRASAHTRQRRRPGVELPRAHARARARRPGASSTETVLAPATDGGRAPPGSRSRAGGGGRGELHQARAHGGDGRGAELPRMTTLFGKGGGGARRQRGLAAVRCNVKKEELRVTSPHC